MKTDDYSVSITITLSNKELKQLREVDLLSVCAAIDSIYQAPKGKPISENNTVMKILLCLQNVAEDNS